MPSSAVESYRKVSDVIGEEMNDAWKSILERLASGNLSSLSSNTQITEDDLQGFFSVLGGANLAVGFSCIEPIGGVTRAFGHVIQPNIASATFIEGSISIGVNIGF